MRAKRYMHMRDGVTRTVAPACDSSLESFQRLLALVHPSISDRQTKPWPASKFSCFFVELNCFIETSHFAIQCCQQRLTIMGKCWIKLQCALAGRHRFVVKTKVAIELARKIVHPK